MSDFMELAKARYSTRKYLDKPVEAEKLERIIEAGRIAPTAVNKQPQRCLVVNTPENIVKMDAATPFRYGARTAIIVCFERSAAWVRSYDNKDSAEIDATIVTTQMMLEAEELGLGSVWVMHFDPVKLREAYAIPEKYEPCAILILGYKAEDVKPAHLHDEKLPKEATVFYESFN